MVKQGVVLLEVKEGELGKDCGEELEFAGVALRGGEVVSWGEEGFGDAYELLDEFGEFGVVGGEGLGVFVGVEIQLIDVDKPWHDQVVELVVNFIR